MKRKIKLIGHSLRNYLHNHGEKNKRVGFTRYQPLRKTARDGHELPQQQYPSDGGQRLGGIGETKSVVTPDFCAICGNDSAPPFNVPT